MAVKLLGRAEQVRYLRERWNVTTSVPSLNNMAVRGCGPQYSIVCGRAVSTETALDRWVEAQMARSLSEVRAGRAKPGTKPKSETPNKRRQVAAA